MSEADGVARDPAEQLAHRVAGEAERRGLTVAVAESLTGGLLASQLAAAPGASGWFRGAVVAYASEVKRTVLGVPDGPVVSRAAAEQMAAGVAHLLGADVTVAVTGGGGPDAQDGEPPGTVWVGLHGNGATPAHRLSIEGDDPAEICSGTTVAALRLLLNLIRAAE